MKVAIDISPLKSGHKFRGIGTYAKNLSKEFQTHYKKENIEFLEEINKLPPDIDVVHYPYFDLFRRTLSQPTKAKTVVTIHDVIPLIFPQHFPTGIRAYINLFFQKRALLKVDAVICDSETSKEDIAEKLSYPKGKIHVVYLAASDIFKPSDKNLPKIAKKYKLPKDFVLYVGDVNWNKNINGLLEAIKIADVNLVMVGDALLRKGLKETAEIEKKIKSLNITQKIIHTGYVPDSDLVGIYSLAKLTVQPSYYEGFGLPVLESMACGTPVVCSQVASLSEIAKNAAIFCDPGSPQDIAEKIKNVLSLSQEELKVLRSKSIQNASNFSWKKVAKETLGVYKKVLR